MVTAHLLPKGILWVNYEPDWAMERGDMLQTNDQEIAKQMDGMTSGRTSRRMNGQTDHRWRGPNYYV